jgi:hypothetical protein
MDFIQFICVFNDLLLFLKPDLGLLPAFGYYYSFNFFLVVLLQIFFPVWSLVWIGA